MSTISSISTKQTIYLSPLLTEH